MTRLDGHNSKAVRRCVNLRMTGAEAGDFVVSLKPPCLLEFRQKGRRRRLTMTIESAYRLACAQAATQLMRERKEQRKLARLAKAMAV